MIIIAVLYGVIGYLEWRYLQRNKRKPRTFRIVMGVILLLLVGVEVIYWLRERWSIGSFVESVFHPMQRFLFFET